MFIVHSAWGVIDEVWDGSYWVTPTLAGAIELGLKLIAQEIDGEIYDDEGIDPYVIQQAIDAGDFAAANHLYTEWCRHNENHPATIRILEMREPRDDGTQCAGLVQADDLRLNTTP
jgi:hypothetical protein